MKFSNVCFLVCVWIISAALIYIGMNVSGAAYPLFGLAVPMIISLGVVNKEN